MHASHDPLDRVDRARLVESGGARDDSPSWDLSRVKQGRRREATGVKGERI